jgi:hypothetical protein
MLIVLLAGSSWRLDVTIVNVAMPTIGVRCTPRGRAPARGGRLYVSYAMMLITGANG